jgi:hypothetical protein
MNLKTLLMVPDPTSKEAEADDAVAHDHNGGKNRIAR